MLHEELGNSQDETEVFVKERSVLDQQHKWEGYAQHHLKILSLSSQNSPKVSPLTKQVYTTSFSPFEAQA